MSKSLLSAEWHVHGPVGDRTAVKSRLRAPTRVLQSANQWLHSVLADKILISVGT